MLCTLYVEGMGDMIFRYKNLVISDIVQYDRIEKQFLWNRFPFREKMHEKNSVRGY